MKCCLSKEEVLQYEVKPAITHASYLSLNQIPKKVSNRVNRSMNCFLSSITQN